MQIISLIMHNTKKLRTEMDSAGKTTLISTVYKTIGFQKVLSISGIKHIHTSQFHVDVGYFKG